MQSVTPKPNNILKNDRNRVSLLTIIFATLLISSCDKLPTSTQEPKPVIAETSPDKVPGGSRNRNIAANDLGATPMTERIAVIGLLNKRTGKSRDIRLNPDQSIRFGNVVVKVQACERTAPWETYPDIGAFTQLFVKERPPGTNQSVRWRKIFSGWLHKNNPAQNVVEHGLYDVWVKDCIMLFPSETEPPFNDTSAPTDPDLSEPDSQPSNAPQIPSPRAAPSVTSEPTAPEIDALKVNEPEEEAPEVIPPPAAPPEPVEEPEDPSEQSLEDLVDSALDG